MKSPHPYLTLASIVAIGFLQNLQGSTVTNSSDSGPGSLRNAIASAVNGETINFAPALNGATITLTSGHLLIDNLVVNIDAASLPAGISLSGNALHRIFAINGTSNVTLQSLKLINGKVINENGGGLYLAGGNLNMLDCTVRDCFATYNGGAIYFSVGVTSTIERSRISGNSTGNLGFGGGIFVGGASTTLLRSCVIAGNSSPFGGGISTFNASPTLTNCTVQGNSGGGFRSDQNSDPAIRNCIVWGNSGTGNTASQQLINLNGSNPGVSYSLIQGASDSASFNDSNAVVWGTGNLNGSLVSNDPKFASALAAGSAPHLGGDLRLLTGSPALDQGNNLAEVGALDASKAARIQNATVDLGAYEGSFVTFALLYPSLASGADANRNGVSNFQEYAMGFDPSAAGNLQVNPGISFAGGFKFLTINQRINGVDFTPRLVTTTSFDVWAEMMEGVHYSVESTSSPTSQRKVLVLRLISADPKRFYRQGYATVN
ncbi:MAG: right-handed parallel beta-helix repeat-containing protein [Verrucomicrobiota bacterium]